MRCRMYLGLVNRGCRRNIQAKSSRNLKSAVLPQSGGNISGVYATAIVFEDEPSKEEFLGSPPRRRHTPQNNLFSAPDWPSP